MKSSTKFIPVFQPRDTIEAGLISGALEHAGIVCYVNNENLSAVKMGGGGIGVGRMTVMVPESQITKSLEIIADLGME